jgi:universal stress protein E
MRRLLAATDLSSRSDRAVRRAGMMARQLGAELLVLHVVDEDQPAALAEAQRRQTTAFLEEQVRGLPELSDIRPQVLVEAGDAFEGILRVAEDHAVALVVMGAHRKRLLRDIFVGTTVERVMRLGHRPVLMVNRDLTGPYRRILAPVDLSEASARALQASKALGLLEGAVLTVLHAFLPFATGMMAYAGIDQDRIKEHAAQAAVEAGEHLALFLRKIDLDGVDYETALEEGAPFEAIERVSEAYQPELIVIGTRGHTGLKKALLGSVADQVLRELDCDVLAVPPDGSR